MPAAKVTGPPIILIRVAPALRDKEQRLALHTHSVLDLFGPIPVG
jgi:hypothetical protein